MHIPSARVAREMYSEPAAVWFVPANAGEELAFLIKAPTTCIKALVAGCRMSLVLSSYEGVLCARVRIYDVPGAPVLVCGVARHFEEHESLLRFAKDKASPVFLFNELDASVAWSNALLGEEESKRISNLLAGSELYTGPYTARESLVLDRFCVSVDPSLSAKICASPIPFEELPVALEGWRSNLISYVGVGTHHDVLVGDPDEGGVFEAAAWASLEGMFTGSIWRAPTVKIGDSERELVDVLAYYPYGTFLIEAKDLAILSAGPTRQRERRVAGTIKQAKKAITQLVGASKAVRRREVVKDAGGRILAPVVTQPMHCIVLLTEMMHEGDWSQVARLRQRAISETGEFFHALDFAELNFMARIAKGRATNFDALLIERCRHFAERESVHLRVQLGPEPSDEGS